MKDCPTCRLDGCEREAMYKAERLCQMHYFRRMRNGHFGLNPRKPKYTDSKIRHSAGYIVLRRPGHPLASKDGQVYEHRFVVYEKYGENLPPCEFCGQASNWHSRKTHIDHIDRDKANNHPDNLRVLCNPCNAQRDVKTHEREGVVAITIDGVTMTARKWANQPGVRFCGASIYRRKKSGMSDYDCVYGRKVTHNSR